MARSDLITLIKQHSVVVQITLLNNTGVIPGNRPAESCLTPLLIIHVQQFGRGRIATCAGRGKQEAGALLSFTKMEFGMAAHVL